ncbi:MAG: GNAT family N-acetyltransferase [Bacteroidales bacterium]|nr:GNAT family N-acetyltransferase [Bacteroidales bacterium]
MEHNIILKLTEPSDLEYFFRFQLDQEAIHLAAFTSENPADKDAYMSKHNKLLKDPTINHQTIFVGEEIAGSISKFEMEGHAEIAYWIDKKFWGKGIATSALTMFLSLEHTRPIFGRVAFDNIGSQRVLEKNGFMSIGTDKGYANARKAEIKEYIYKLG